MPTHKDSVRNPRVYSGRIKDSAKLSEVIPLRIDTPNYRKLAEVAKAEDRSVAALIRVMIKEGLESRKSK
jgi:hypothetical protein